MWFDLNRSKFCVLKSVLTTTEIMIPICIRLFELSADYFDVPLFWKVCYVLLFLSIESNVNEALGSLVHVKS